MLDKNKIDTDGDVLTSSTAAKSAKHYIRDLYKGHKMAMVNTKTKSSKLKQQYNPLIDGMFE